jgi:hypothetical protein
MVKRKESESGKERIRGTRWLTREKQGRGMRVDLEGWMNWVVGALNNLGSWQMG